MPRQGHPWWASTRSRRRRCGCNVSREGCGPRGAVADANATSAKTNHRHFPVQRRHTAPGGGEGPYVCRLNCRPHVTSRPQPPSSFPQLTCWLLALPGKYKNPWGFLRMGKLLEDLDSLAGTVAFAHWCAEQGLPLTRSPIDEYGVKIRVS